MSLLGSYEQRRWKLERAADPWLATAAACPRQGRVRWPGTCEQSNGARRARGASAPAHSGDIPASGEVDGGVGLDGGAGPRPHARGV